jgi:hypothetical protein
MSSMTCAVALAAGVRSNPHRHTSKMDAFRERVERAREPQDILETVYHHRLLPIEHWRNQRGTVAGRAL